MMMKSTYLFFLLLFAKSESQAFLFLSCLFLSTKVATSQTIEHYYYLLPNLLQDERERDNIIGIIYIYIL